MKTVFKYLFSIAILYALSVGAQARKYPNGLTEDSVDPVSDSIAIGKVRAKMDSIRKEQGRPTIALVLCGGGAKGAAEVGAMRLLEEMQIPVDMICGTSIGSLLGGLYSVGYDQKFLEELMRTADWEKLLSDKVENKYFSLYNKEYKSIYPLAIPFHYARNVNQSREVKKEEYAEHDGRLHLNDTKANLSTQTGMAALMSSLPSGYVYGFNVNNLFSALTVGYHDSMAFADLPIPFCCVSTDLVSCKAKNLTDGHLKQAMRSSMGIPGLFSTVRTEGMVLVDGGMRNNFPVDIARAMGADYGIGIDLMDKYAGYEKVTNAGTMFSQIIAMALRDSYEINRQNVDVYIRPDLDGYTSLSFSKESVDTLINRGYLAACRKMDELSLLKSMVGDATTQRKGRLAVNLNEKAVELDAVVIEGLPDRDSKFLQERIGLDVTRKISFSDIEKAMYIIQETGSVESVTYSLLGTAEPYRLVFSCNPAPVHRLGISARLDTECWAEIGLNLGLNAKRLSGPKLDVDLKLGRCQRLNLHFKYDVLEFPTINVEGRFTNNNFNTISEGVKLETSNFSHEEKVYLSRGSLARNFDIRGGVRNLSYKYPNNKVSSITALDVELMTGSYLGAFLCGQVNTMDRISVPTKGVDAKLAYVYDFVKYGVSTFKPVGAFTADVKFVAPVAGRFSIVPDIHFRNLIDPQPDYYINGGDLNLAYSPFHKNVIGGDIAGRYYSQQIPFVGFDNLVICQVNDQEGIPALADHVMVANLDIRCEVANKLYVSLLGGWAHMSDTIDRYFKYGESTNYWAHGVQALYNTIVGPIKFRVTYCNYLKGILDYKNSKGVSAYLSVGFDF